MKIGMRSPSLSRSFKARTTGKYKRITKRAINPLYGKKGVGFAKNPGKSIKSAVYHRTTFGVGDVVKMTSSSSKRTSSTNSAAKRNTCAYSEEESLRCPNCGHPVRKSDVSSYYLCDNCKTRIHSEDIMEQHIPKAKKRSKGKGGCFGWACSIILIVLGVYCLANLFPSNSDKETAPESTTNTVLQTETVATTEQPIQTENEVSSDAQVTYNSDEPETHSYVLNTNTMKFHYITCNSVSKIADENYETYEGTRDDLMNQGYEPCGHCHP
ncbi:hypothetical protein [Frisingicoccus sp.]|uniref:hypothetical protein n=1 Tax=Frisingicoccus sp. TaxID=1918627 RepID=UPI002E784169|nr:hypothetical protein [Frisingicoccus sp.]MEE0751443.1 hypothetical protein [Frisingicoccus sp.]